jgi:lysophospholipase L1-like esterase
MKIQTTLTTFVLLLFVSAGTFAQTNDQSSESTGLQALTAAATPLREGERIAFFGDSVTMQGGYLQIMQKALAESATTKSMDIQLLKHGLNGGRVPTVLAGESPWGKLGGTMKSLLEQEKPSIVVIYLGINDVWHGAKGTTKPDFESGLNEMIALSKSAGATIILCTPSVIGEETKDNAKNDMLNEYANITRKLAEENSLVLCDIHLAFVDRLKRINLDNEHKGNLTYDGVHMNEQGNALLSDKISAAIVKACKQRNATD